MTANAGSERSAFLRQRAEKVLQRQPEELRATPPEDIQHLVHELQVYQIELEMQNDELRRTQQEMELARDRYLDLYDFSPVGYVTIDELGLILQVNLTATSMLGVERARLLSQPFSCYVFSEDQDTYYLHRRKLLQTQEPQVCKLRMVRRDGSQFWARLDAVVILDSDGQAVSRATVSDTTELVQAEEAVQLLAQQWRDAFDALSDPVSLLDRDGRILRANKAMAEVTGLTFEQMAGQTCCQVVRGSQEPIDSCPLFRMARTRRKETLVVPLGNRTFDIAVDPIFDDSGSLDGAVLLMTDVTERKRANEALQKQAQRLRGLTLQLGEVQETERMRLAQELHDQVGQNLAALGINLGLARSHLSRANAKAAETYLQECQSLASGIGGIVRGVMDGLRPPMMDDFGLFASLRWHASLFGRQTSLAVEVIGDTLSRRLAPLQEIGLFRIAQEALTNIAKHAHASRATVSLSERDKVVRLVITDDGVGFEPSLAKQPSEGGGWGLVTMVERADALGGSLSIDSAPGQGTRIVAELPR